MGQRQRVLIIDDSKEIVAALKAFFERKYEVITAYDGFGGLRAFEQNEDCIDLVITDLLMPELDGYGMISILKKKYPRTPIIAITGWRGNVEASGTKIYADQIFEKPIDLFDLDESVSWLLEKRRLSSLTESSNC
jgi:DNA-binding NtrC family response regulator